MAAPAISTLFQTEDGAPHPLGATIQANGVNFSLFSSSATGVELLLFDECDSPQALQTIPLIPSKNKTFHFWHIFVKELKAGAHYAFRVSGPFAPEGGLRHNRNKVLIDPYARGNTKTVWNRSDACNGSDNVSTSLRSVVIDPAGYDWEGDKPLNRPIEDAIVYEMHVRGFTKSPTSKVKYPGTFAGLIEKIPYLKDLGITAVEFLPVFDFDETTPLRMMDGKPLWNFWGYSTMGYFAPHSAFCVRPEEGLHLKEFRDAVKALHKAGIEVILDVVFNHTDEGNQQGPTLCFRGIDNRSYYFLVPWAMQFYTDYSGCGNTFNCNHPMVEKLIVECLRFWVNEAHVDGFRFDEGSILSRGEDGLPAVHPPLVWQAELDEDLMDTKLIAEAWDAAGLYQIGHFPGDRWGEWNGRYRDIIRRFVKGDGGVVAQVADAIGGSSSLYEARGGEPTNSINFVNCHDGFTLNDLVSYNNKHNEGNGEGNNDGNNENTSWNCGAEGETSDANIEKLREQQIRNFATILMLSRGVPMFVAGDEARNTQHGNNNAYCQDNEISWFDWGRPEKHADLLRFWRRMIEFRKRHAVVRMNAFYTGEVNKRGLKDVAWHGTKLDSPGWDDSQARALGFTLAGVDQDPDIHMMMNMYWEALDMDVPVITGRQWARVVDTSMPSPSDIADPGKEVVYSGQSYRVNARSIVVLVNKPA
ncbi:MAG: glycogen debranching protein GlgX [Edaphobacter sp.]